MNDAASRYPNVFQPLTVGNVEIRHHIMITGHTLLYGHNGTLGERYIDYYRERARGGATRRNLHRLGDVVAPRRLEAVIFEAEQLARRI